MAEPSTCIIRDPNGREITRAYDLAESKVIADRLGVGAEIEMLRDLSRTND